MFLSWFSDFNLSWSQMTLDLYEKIEIIYLQTKNSQQLPLIGLQPTASFDLTWPLTFVKTAEIINSLRVTNDSCLKLQQPSVAVISPSTFSDDNLWWAQITCDLHINQL